MKRIGDEFTDTQIRRARDDAAKHGDDLAAWMLASELHYRNLERRGVA